MPVLPLNFPRSAGAASSAGSRILETARDVAHSLSSHAAKVLKRVATAVPSSLTDHAQSTLERRQSYILVIPTQYANIDNSPSPGAVVGIILGSVFGFLLIMYLLYIASNGGGFIRSEEVIAEDVSVARSRGTRSRRARTEMSSVPPPPRRRSRERIIRTERIVRDVNPPREPSRIRERIIVEDVRPERRVDGDDVVEVIEEHSSISLPPPRRKSRRGSYRSVEQDTRTYYD